jgi:starvation-inducible DNA-binding protein
MKTTALSHKLNELLGSEFVLATKIRNAHWNLRSFHFQVQHEYFGQLYNESNTRIDEIAERTRMIGAWAEGHLAGLLQKSILKEHEEPLHKEADAFDLIAADFGTLIPFIKEIIALAEAENDPGTEDFLTGILREYEKTKWFLDAHEPIN